MEQNIGLKRQIKLRKQTNGKCINFGSADENK
jgi:hypothetical protein